MANPVPTPLASEALVDAERKPTASWYRVLTRLIGQFNLAASDVEGKPIKEQDWSESVIIESADNKDYRFVDLAFGWTITSVVTRSLAGTCTLTVKINSTALGGSANSVSTTEQTQVHTTANVVAPGDDLVLTVSSASAAEGVSVTLKGKRTFV